MQGSYSAVTGLLEGVDDNAFFRPTLCTGWVVSDLVFHLMLDAQRALIAFATPSEDPPDVDFITYWRPWSSDSESAVAHARFVRIAASAYSTPSSLVAHGRATAEAVVRAASEIDMAGRVATQGHTLTVPDFLATLAVEATVHYLDLVAFLDDAPNPDGAALALVRRTLDGLAGTSVDMAWDDRVYALKATGRLPLTDDEPEQLGSIAGDFPLFS
ncbi:MAG: maleylpyruvate isomerase N-terminal domain-containing protein [Actinomycetota bacterium]